MTKEVLGFIMVFVFGVGWNGPASRSTQQSGVLSASLCSAFVFILQVNHLNFYPFHQPNHILLQNPKIF